MRRRINRVKKRDFLVVITEPHSFIKGKSYKQVIGKLDIDENGKRAGKDFPFGQRAGNK